MFSISKKTQYGIVAILELAERYGHGLMQIREIVAKRNIPKNYLEQIFNRLGKQGIVKSTRGNHGGYELAVDPGSLTVYRVLESLEGELKLGDEDDLLVIKKLYAKVSDDIRNALQVTIAELAAQQRSLEQKPMFYI